MNDHDDYILLLLASNSHDPILLADPITVHIFVFSENIFDVSTFEEITTPKSKIHSINQSKIDEFVLERLYKY